MKFQPHQLTKMGLMSEVLLYAPKKSVKVGDLFVTKLTLALQPFI